MEDRSVQMHRIFGINLLWLLSLVAGVVCLRLRRQGIDVSGVKE